MSTLKLNLIDSLTILSGEIHGSVADSCVAALSAEPETISELEAALARYIRPAHPPFALLQRCTEIDSEPVDAGIVVIDLAARVVAVESSYSQPLNEGEVRYHDGVSSTEVSVLYRVPDDWLFVNSVEAYRWSSERRRMARQSTPLIDTRSVLYGTALHEFLKREIESVWPRLGSMDEANVNDEIVRVHREWLMTPRADLRGKSPRQVLLEKQDFIDFDLHTRCLQWSELNEGPPCLPRESFAYRFAGFGTHEWVIYYDLVRRLLYCLVFGSDSSSELQTDLAVAADVCSMGTIQAVAEVTDASFSEELRRERSVVMREGPLSIKMLERIQSVWMETPDSEPNGRSPANIIENERRRLPEVASSKELLIDEDCECCRMMALDAEMGFGPTFWHLDGCNMEDEFAFSNYLTSQEWEAEQRRWGKLMH